MKDKKQIESISDAELAQLFNQASSTQEKLHYFSRIQDYTCQMELLNSISVKIAILIARFFIKNLKIFKR